MDNQYPTNKINELNAHMLNFNQDILDIKEISVKINNWVNRGIALDTAKEPLNAQITDWENIMEELLESFKQNLLKLKEVDDRIESVNSFNIQDLGDTYTDKWSNLYSLYQNLFENLKNDTEILQNAKTDITKYNSLGIKLEDTLTTIDDYINNITNAINTSLNSLQELSDKI
jgi:vacuolar-type H+-ATPase subunit I/STV1